MKSIGKGAFTKAFKNDKGAAILFSCCPVKEAASFDMLPDYFRVPKVEILDYNVYKMEYFDCTKGSVKSHLKARDYELYQILRQLPLSCGFRNGSDYWQNTFRDAKRTYPKFKKDFEVLWEIVEAMRNYTTNLKFEISPRNIAIKNGKLIFLDLFFDCNILRSQNTIQHRKERVNTAPYKTA